MIYTLFIWTVVAVSNGNTHHDWRSIAVLESTNTVNALDKCENVTRELNIARERYRCVRTK